MTLETVAGAINKVAFWLFLGWAVMIPFDLNAVHNNPNAPACKVILSNINFMWVAPGWYFGCELWSVK